MKNNLLFLFYFLQSLFIWGQDEPRENIYKDYTLLQNFQAPSVASLNTYGAIPVSLFTGTPDISVPLHTIKTSSFEVPISIRYNINNVKPNNHPGITGLGWTLFAGGSITLIQKGDYFDEHDYGFFNNRNRLADNWYDYDKPDSPNEYYPTVKVPWSSQARLDYATSPFHASHDLSPDKFVFNFLNYSGEFYMGIDGNWIVDSDLPFKVSYQLMTYQEVRPFVKKGISVIDIKYPNLTRSTIKSITLTAPDGMKFTFGGVKGDAIDYSVPYFTQHSGNHYPIATTWHLTSIEPAKSVSAYTENITFEYEDSPPNLEGNWGFYYDLLKNKNYLFDKGLSFQLIMPVVLKNISTTSLGEVVRLSYKETTELKYAEKYFPELAPYTNAPIEMEIAYHVCCEGASTEGTYVKSLSEIKWLQLNNIQIYQPNYSIFFEYTSSLKERLKLLKIKKEGAGSSDETYNFQYNQSLLPPYFKGHYDHLGFYNCGNFSSLNNLSFFQNLSKSSSSYYYNKKLDDTFKNYAAQFYALRHGDIQTTDSECSQAEILYKITYPTKGYSILEYEPNIVTLQVAPKRDNLKDADISYPGGIRIRKVKRYDNNGDLEYTTGYYYQSNFNIKDKDSGVNNYGVLAFTPQYYWTLYKDVFFSNAIFTSGGTNQAYFNLEGSPSVEYGFVIEAQEDARGTVMGYTENIFSHLGFGKEYYDISYIASIQGQDLNPDSPFGSNRKKRGKLLCKRTYDNKGTILQEETYNYEVQNLKEIRNISIQNRSTNYSKYNAYGGSYIQPIYDYPNISQKTIDYTYENGKKEENISLQEFTYKDKLLKNLYQEKSDGKILEKRYKHASDYINNSIYSNLVSRNMILLPIEEITLVDNLEISRIKRNYKNGLLGLIDYRVPPIPVYGSIPANLEVSYSGESGMKEIESYQSFDYYNNLVECTNKEGRKIFYLWSYGGEHPVAEIENGTYAEIEAAVKTVFSVASIDVLSKQKTPDEAKLMNGSLQDALPNSLVSTYTYKTLVGIQSMTNPQKATTTYQYDNFGRLIKVTDANGKVIQTYNYHFQD